MEGAGKDGRRVTISPLAARILMVVTVVALFGLLYPLMLGLRSPAPGIPLTVTVARDGANWSVTFTEVPAGRLPSEMYLLIRNASGGIVFLRTSFSDLTTANWSTDRILYVDGNPGVPEVMRGDGLRIDLASYQEESVIEISDRTRVLLIKPLR